MRKTIEVLCLSMLIIAGLNGAAYAQAPLGDEDGMVIVVTELVQPYETAYSADQILESEHVIFEDRDAKLSPQPALPAPCFSVSMEQNKPLLQDVEPGFSEVPASQSALLTVLDCQQPGMSEVPEPTTLLLLAAGLIGMIGFARRNRQ